MQQEQENFIVEQEKPVESVESVAVSQQLTELDDELSLDDITHKPRQKTREEIIAEAEAAAFAQE